MKTLKWSVSKKKTWHPLDSHTSVEPLIPRHFKKSIENKTLTCDFGYLLESLYRWSEQKVRVQFPLVSTSVLKAADWHFHLKWKSECFYSKHRDMLDMKNFT